MIAVRWTCLGAAAVVSLGLVSGAAQAQAPATPAVPATPATPAMPGGQEDMMKMMYLAAHNQLGMLQYCQAQGSVGQDVVDIQKRVLGMLPPAKVDGLDAAEEAGRKGTVQFGGNQVDIKQAAASQNTTPDAMCKKIGEMLKMQAAQLPK